jgi:hypothetical protein
MKTKIWLVCFYFFLAAGLAIVLMACGGSSGGGTNPGISYTGNTAQALINDGEVAVDFAVDTWLFVDLGKVILQQMERVLEGSVIEIPSNISETIPAPCGGDATFDGSVTDAEAMTASILFENYCVDEDIVMSGSADFTGTVDLGTNEVVQFTLSLNSSTFEISGISIAIDGTFSADWETMQVTMSYILKFKNPATTNFETYWLDVDPIQLGGEEGPYTDFTSIIGRYYDYEYGYVDISVGDIIRIWDFDVGPSSGSLILSGAQGTKALLTFLNSVEFRVDADTDGDGFYNDYSSGTQLW